ncbi:serine/threonine-protein kinase HipA [Gemmobacter caeni]|uniref:Serine/threonine-protein kinase HipA n=1 Tax=Gemmobacter caeni TaxID=589035 RepID=A0A2T6B878_9RHOB|nr:HipA domain-containing protein [Gemmobacter caeni]PTX52263.1 serine/threonine-protein kinase HipA [Gemmobacter caeni]TWJ02636.1 serine/threonine-protein kinase HipA [Gemmobacter caeni]
MSLDRIFCWYLGDPGAPCLIGEVRLEANARTCILRLEPDWRASGFDLTPGTSNANDLHATEPGLRAPGALDDAIPDQWGERIIRVISRPSRMSPIDLLWYAGDRRFGALGISSSPTEYRPFPEPPLLQAASIREAEEVIGRVMAREPLTDRERELIASAGSLGGAHPKMLVEEDGAEWIAKFPKGQNVDQLLIEHASMELARRAGLNVAESRAVRGGIDHVLLVRRFDRTGDRREHAVSARTLLAREGDDSYATISGLIRKLAAPGEILAQQRELFGRMAFNIMIDNTDDHTKNHAFLRREDGTWGLSPAYDVPVQMNGLGVQAIQISPDPRMLNRFDREHAVAAAPRFGMRPEEALAEWNRIAGHVALWRDVFAEVGVTEGDLDYLADFLDSPEKRGYRKDATPPQNDGLDGGLR